MGQPDDPNNNQRAKPPRLEHNPEFGAIENLISNLNQKAFPTLQLGGLMPNKMREFLAYCFIAETNIRAQDAVLVSQVLTTPGQAPQSRCWYEQRWPSEPEHKTHMIRLEQINRAQQELIKDLKARLALYEKKTPP